MEARNAFAAVPVHVRVVVRNCAGCALAVQRRWEPFGTELETVGVGLQLATDNDVFVHVVVARAFLGTLSVLDITDIYVLKRAIRARADALSNVIVLFLGNKL